MGRQHLTRPTGGRRASATANPNTHLHAGKTTGPAPATSHGQTPTPQGPHGHAGSGALKEPTLPRRGEGERPSPQRQRGGVGAAPGPRRARHRRHEGEDAGSALGHKSRTRRGNGHGIPPPHTRAVPRRLGHRSPPLATLHIFSHAHPRAPPPGPLHATAPTTAHTGRPSRHLPPIQPSGSPCPEKHRDPEGTLPRGDHAGRGGREGWAQPNTRADRRPTTASRSPGWRAGEAESCPLAPQPRGRAGRTTRAPAKPRPTRQHTESDAEGTRAHGHARRSPTRRKSDGPPARPGGTLPRHGGGRRGPRPLGPKEQRPGPHRGDRQTHQHAYASPQQKGQTGRTGGVRHPTHSAQEGRRPGDNGTPSEGTPLSRIAREGVPHRRWATPHPNCPPPAGPAGGKPREHHPRDRSIGRGGLRYREETAPRASAARARAGWAHYQSHSPQPSRPPHSSGQTGPHRDCSTHLAHTTPRGQGGKRAGMRPPSRYPTHTWGRRHDTGSLPPSEAKHTRVSFSYRLDPPKTPKGHRQQPEAAAAATPGRGRWGDRSNTTTRLQAPEAQPGPLQGHRTGSRGGKAPQPQSPRQGDGEGCPPRQRTPTPPARKSTGTAEAGPVSAPLPPTHHPQVGKAERGARRPEREAQQHSP